MTDSEAHETEPRARSRSIKETRELPRVSDAGPDAPASPSTTGRGTRWLRRLLFLVGTIGVIFALVLGLKTVNLFPKLSNPFATKTTDRTGPPLLVSIQDLSRYVSAEGNFQVLIDLQKNKQLIPDIILNDRILFVGVGSVDAYVDFSTIGEGAIKESADHKSVALVLPAPQLGKPNIDHDNSYVFAEQRGIINRVNDFLGGDLNREQQLYQLAEEKIAQAARDSGLQQRAETNTRAMLMSMLHSLGYETVTITFNTP